MTTTTAQNITGHYTVSQITHNGLTTEVRRQATVIGDSALWSLRHGWRAEMRRNAEWSSDWISVVEA